MAFFAASTLEQSKPPTKLVPQCGSCGLFKGCLSPKIPVAGKGRRRILLVGEGPGKSEDQQNKPFVGSSGQLLQDTLRKYGVNMFRDCHVTNAVICRTNAENRTPTKNEIEYCRPNVINAIKKYKPEVIILLGGPAVTSVIGWLWKDDPGSISRWAGFQIPNQMLNAWICPTYHPAFVAREDNGRSVIPLFFRRHLKAACKLEGRPWKKIPDYKREVQVILDPDIAVDYIQAFGQCGSPFAFDYETNMLKPDWPERRIVCVALSDGSTTIAYPWHGKAIDETKELLKSDVPKIAANMKFEHRWTLAELGIEVKNWLFDTMLAAHVLDNRKGITGLKFQAFVRLGHESYNEHIAPYLKSKGDKRTNRMLRDIAIEDLLRYCGLDARLEWELAQLQMKELGL